MVSSLPAWRCSPAAWRAGLLTRPRATSAKPSLWRLTPTSPACPSAVGDVFDRPSVKYRRHTIAGAESIVTYGLEAPPALCTILGALGSFDFQPDVVVSGINNGANVGRSILHSGTVGAILTGAQLGLSGLAVSAQWGDDVIHYETAGALAVEVLDELSRAPQRTLLNLNVPKPSHFRGSRRSPRQRPLRLVW